jgi:hypothetical protein
MKNQSAAQRSTPKLWIRPDEDGMNAFVWERQPRRDGAL